MNTKNRGKVYLVGAGPGDPGLLTCRALELMKSCDVIAYDTLVSPSILALCSPTAELVSVGYRGYGSKQLGYRMHPAIIEAALAGKSVVRLKSGDPLVFGRAGQECEELTENQIPFEIIPGITSAIAAAAYVGIPLTHRDYSSDVIFTSGHDLRGGSASKSNWEALGKSTGTVSVYMAASKIRENCERLIEMGRDPETPAAFISNATRGCQRVTVAKLRNLADQVGEIPKGVPALILAGETVGLYQAQAWFDKKPLHNLTALVVRARRGTSNIASLLRSQGADVIEAPWIEVDREAESLNLLKAINELVHYRHLIFSCEDGVASFFNQLLKSGRDLRKLREIQIVAMGEGVRARLESFAVCADVVLDGHCSKALDKNKGTLSEGRSLVVTSSRGRPSLRQALDALGVSADFVGAYAVSHRFPAIPAPQVDYVILPSSTSARLLLEGPWSEALRETPMIALGPETRKMAESLGASNVFMTSSDEPGSVVEFFRRRHDGN